MLQKPRKKHLLKMTKFSELNSFTFMVVKLDFDAPKI